MRKTKEVPVVWHKGWPPVPTDHTCYQYLLTVKRDGELEVVIDWYLSNSVFENTCEDDVVAWAELPEPFDPETRHSNLWHMWPEKVPPEDQPLQIEVWNDFYEEYEPTVGVFHEGGFFHHDLGALAFSQRLFDRRQKRVFWRLWRGEDEE